MKQADRSSGMTSAELSTCLELVAHERRRRLIQQLRQDTSGKMTIDELATELQEADSISDHGQPPGRKQVTVELHHNHLPKLAAHDVVEYDSETGTIQYQPSERIEAILDTLPEGVPQSNR